MNRVLAEFEKESRDIGNRYRQKDQRILVFGPYRPKGKDWKMGTIIIEETKQVTFLGKLATNKIQGTRTQLSEVAPVSC